MAYLAIPIILVYFVLRRRGDIPFHWVFLMFGLFIVSCGTTHLMEVIVSYTPLYRLSGLIKIITAVVSWATVLALIPIVPRALALRTPEALEREVADRTRELSAANQALQHEIEERRRVEAELSRVDRYKDEFIALLSHELRNPLAPIMNSVQILRLREQNKEPDEYTLRSLDTIERQTRQMARLVDDLLDISRIKQGKFQLQRENIRLDTVVQQAVEMSRPLIEARRHRLVISLPPEPVHLHADPIRLAQIFSNLLLNAAKYMHEGGEIWLGAERDNGKIQVSVRDRGMGIPQEMLPQIFNLFAQVKGTIRHDQGGLGIGLALVKSLVEMHGGSVEASSPGPEQGSTFLVQLPVL